MKKRLTALFAALALLLGLCACSETAGQLTWQEQYDLGVRYLSEGNYEEAIIAFIAAIEIDPKQAPAYVGRGDAYVGLGETEDNLAAAQADYEMAIGLDETLVDAYLGLADVYIKQGDTEKALELLRRGLEATGDGDAFSDRIAELEEGASGGGWPQITEMVLDDGSVLTIEYYEDGSRIERMTSADHTLVEERDPLNRVTRRVEDTFDGNIFIGTYLYQDNSTDVTVSYQWTSNGEIVFLVENFHYTMLAPSNGVRVGGTSASGSVDDLDRTISIVEYRMDAGGEYVRGTDFDLNMAGDVIAVRDNSDWSNSRYG